MAHVQIKKLNPKATIPTRGSAFAAGCDLYACLPDDGEVIIPAHHTVMVPTGIAVAHGRGVLLLACRKAGVAIYEYTPLQVKQSVVGYGRAEKKQVQEMTRIILKLAKIPKPDDTADALAMAICHAHASGSLMGKLNSMGIR